MIEKIDVDFYIKKESELTEEILNMLPERGCAVSVAFDLHRQKPTFFYIADDGNLDFSKDLVTIMNSELSTAIKWEATEGVTVKLNGVTVERAGIMSGLPLGNNILSFNYGEQVRSTDRAHKPYQTEYFESKKGRKDKPFSWGYYIPKFPKTQNRRYEHMFSFIKKSSIPKEES